MLQLNNIAMQFGGRVLFKDVNVSFTPGECFGIIGANGAGKSTLLRIISGDLEPTEGFVSKDPKERLSVLKQDQHAFDDHEVLETVLMGYPRLIQVMKEKDALYAKPDFSDADGVLAAELENEFAEMDGWNAESNAETLLSSLGVSLDNEHKLMKDVDPRDKVKVLLAQISWSWMNQPTTSMRGRAAGLKNF